MTVSTSDLDRHLDANEKTLWHGRPPLGILFRKHDLFFIPFSLLWFGFALFWEASVLGIMADAPTNAPFFFPLVGFVFVCVGFYMAIGRFGWDAYVRRRTLYALTNRRAIVLVHAPFFQLRSIEITPATDVTTEERGDGTGTIYFGPRSAPPSGSRGWSQPGASDDIMFEGIASARSVVSTIRRIQSAK